MAIVSRPGPVGKRLRPGPRDAGTNVFRWRNAAISHRIKTMKRLSPALVFLALTLAAAMADNRLSQLERDWLADRSEVVFVGQTSYPPFEFIHPRRGEYGGMAIELIRWIATEYGFNVVFHPMPFASAQEAVLNGSADALTGIFWSEEREKRFDFTKEVFSVPASIFVRSERTDILDLSDLDGKRIAVQRGDYAIEYLAEQGLTVSFLYTDDFPSALRMVVDGEADALIGDEQIVLYYLYDGGLRDGIKKMAQELYVGSDCMAVAQGNEALLSILEKGLERARVSGTLSRIYEKWLGVGLSAGVTVIQSWSLPIMITLGSLLLVAAGVIVWNLQLNRVVKSKTSELFALNAELKRSNENLTVANAQLLRDMEERARMEEERRRLEARMVKAQNYESLALMAGGVAHDFNNLLTAIIGGVDVALLSVDPASEAVEYLKDAIGIARQAGELARRMLDFSGRTVFSRETIDLVLLVGGMSKILEAASPHRVPLRFSLAGAPVIIRGDTVQIRQVIVNLAANAAEAAVASGEPIDIRVAEENLDESVLAFVRTGAELSPGRFAVIEVRDRGMGMEPRSIDRIFDPFYTTKKTGRGLGLAALAGIVKAHGGAVAVTSVVGGGSVFKVILPLAPAAQADSAQTRLEVGAGQPGRLSGTVLVVDDEDSIRKTTARLVESLGLDVRIATGGMEAAEQVRDGTVQLDLVLLDMSMPGLDGYDTFVMIRALRRDLPVILATGYDDASATERFRDGDLAGILVKPFSRESIYAAFVAAKPSLARPALEDGSLA